MPIIPPIAPAPTIQIFTRWFLITKEDWSAHRSRAGYPGFRKGALTSRLVLDRGEARAGPRKIGSFRENEGVTQRRALSATPDCLASTFRAAGVSIFSRVASVCAVRLPDARRGPIVGSLSLPRLLSFFFSAFFQWVSSNRLQIDERHEAERDRVSLLELLEAVVMQSKCGFELFEEKLDLPRNW